MATKPKLPFRIRLCCHLLLTFLACQYSPPTHARLVEHFERSSFLGLPTDPAQLKIRTEILALVDQKQFKQALSKANSFVTSSPSSVYALHWRALVYENLKFNETNQLARQNYLELGIRDLTRAIDLNPNDSYALKCRAYFYIYLGKHKLAVSDFARSDKLYPLSPVADRIFATALTRTQKYKDALARFEKLPKKVINNAESQCCMALCELRLQRYAQAIENATYAIKHDSKLASAYRIRGESKFLLHETDSETARLKRNDNDSAINDLDRAVELEPTYGGNYQVRGRIQLALGNKSAAIDDLTKAISLRPKQYEPRFRRGTAYLKCGMYTESIADFTSALKLNRNSSAFVDRGIDYLMLNKHELAQADFKSAIQCNPQNSYAYSNCGLDYLHQNKYDDALKNFERAIALSPKDAHAHFCRAITLKRLQRNQESLAELNTAIALNPSDADAYRERASTLQNIGNIEAAVSDLESEMLSSDNDNGTQRSNSDFENQINSGELQTIADSYTKVIKVNSADGNLYYNRGVVNFCRAQYQLSDDDFARSMQLNKNNQKTLVSSACLRSLALRKLKRIDEARLILDSISKTSPGTTQDAPELGYLLGTLTQAQLLNASRSNIRLTKAHFYIAMNELLLGHTAQASEHFNWLRKFGDSRVDECQIGLSEGKKIATVSK